MAEQVQHHPWACADCGAGSAQQPGTTSVRCNVCAGVTEFRRCPRCGHGMPLAPQFREIRRAELRCIQCGEEGKRKHFPSVGIEQVPLPSGFVDAYAELGLSFGDCAGYTGRRSFHGGLVGSSGLSTVGFGGSTGVSLYFEATTLVACIGTMTNAGCIPMSDLTSLSMTSREDFLDTTGTAAPGSSLATSVASSLATRPAAREETVCSITWDDGGIVVLNQTMAPDRAAERFEPVLHRAYRARTDDKESLLDQVARLVIFHDTGLISDGEFQSQATSAFHQKGD